MKARFEKALREAQDAFWNTIAARFPEASAGDLAPESAKKLEWESRKLLWEWLNANFPWPTPQDLGFVEGARIRLRADVERYPHFIAPAGCEGTVVVVEEGFLAVRMDKPIEGAEEWDNEVHWNDDEVRSLAYYVEVVGTN